MHLSWGRSQTPSKSTALGRHNDIATSKSLCCEHSTVNQLVNQNSPGHGCESARPPQHAVLQGILQAGNLQGSCSCTLCAALLARAATAAAAADSAAVRPRCRACCSALFRKSASSLSCAKWSCAASLPSETTSQNTSAMQSPGEPRCSWHWLRRHTPEMFLESGQECAGFSDLGGKKGVRSMAERRQWGQPAGHCAWHPPRSGASPSRLPWSSGGTPASAPPRWLLCFPPLPHCLSASTQLTLGS